MSKLDDILGLYRRDIERHYGGRTVGRTLSGDEAVQQIKSLILELIGPGESLTEEQIANGRIYKFCDPQGDAVDRYKDGLRKKVEEL